MKKILKKITLLLFLSLFISIGNLFAQIVFVEDITGVPDTAIVGKPLTLTGTVVPANATFQNIIWSIFDAGTTGATITENILNTTVEGTAIVKAKITESVTGDGFVKNFAIKVFLYVPVEDIVDVPDTAIAGVPLLLTGTVMPENATHKNITWTVFDAGTTGATITENTLHTNSTGTVTLTATINETLVGTSFTKNFTIEVKELVGINDLELANINIYPNPITNELRIENYDLRIEGVEIYDICGRKVFEQKENLTVLRSYDITVFPAGVYFVKIQTETGEVVRKVVKQ